MCVPLVSCCPIGTPQKYCQENYLSCTHNDPAQRGDYGVVPTYLEPGPDYYAPTGHYQSGGRAHGGPDHVNWCERERERERTSERERERQRETERERERERQRVTERDRERQRASALHASCATFTGKQSNDLLHNDTDFLHFLSVSRARVVLSLSLVLPGAAPPSIVARATASRKHFLVFYFHMVVIPVKV